MKLRMLVEVDIEGAGGRDPEERSWLYRDVLHVGIDSGGLLLHSNELGEELGRVKVLGVQDASEPSAYEEDVLNTWFNEVS